MPINYWRRKSYDGDGHETNQCLQCYGEFGNVGHNWRFCPVCGTRWAGQWPPEEVRREQERITDACYRAASNLRQTDPPAEWVIEHRVTQQLENRDWVAGKWAAAHRVPAYVETLPEVLAYYKRYLADYASPELSFRRYEYRLRLVRPEPQPPFYRRDGG